VVFTNFAILAMIAVLTLLIGFKAYVLIQIPIMLMGGALGLWLFYVQHQFEDAYWARQQACDPFRVAMEGSSYLQLPKILQWFSANIGLHHINHIRPTIPNYQLQQCFDDILALQAIEPMTIQTSFKTLKLSLYDEQQSAMVSFRALKTPAVY